MIKFSYDKGKKDGRTVYCKPCAVVRASEWSKNNKEKASRNKKVYWEKNKEKVKVAQRKLYYRTPEKQVAKRLRASFGMTLEQYDEMREKQGFSCAICGRHETTLVRRLAVGHCHETKKIRGLLCNSCNRGIGFFGDSISYLSSAINYLEMSKSDG